MTLKKLKDGIFCMSVKLDFYVEGRSQTNGVSKQGAEKNICTLDEVTRGWRKLHNEEFHDLFSLPNVTRVIKSTKMR
jgi:hypothetical protein